MRLTADQLDVIRQEVRRLDPEAAVYLFGSRVDDGRRGGDIDLLIFSGVITERLKRRLRLALYDRLGEQKIDIVVARDERDPFVRMAKQQGVSL